MHKFGTRALLIGLALAVVLSGTPARVNADAAASALPTDIHGHWAESYIVQLVQRGVIRGYEDGTFRPDRPVTRAEFVALLVRELHPSAQPAVQSAFEDVSSAHWAFTAIQTAVAAGWLKPAEYNSRLRPDAAITRGEAARLIVRAAGLASEAAALKGTSTTFSDVGGDVRPYVDVALAHGLLTGFPRGLFKPGGSLTRAEAGVIVLRLTDPSIRPATWLETYTFKVPSGTNRVQVVRINLNRPDITVKPYVAQGQVGKTEELMSMVKDTGAVAAINGTYFAAYKDRYPDSFGEPFGTLVIDGRWVHLDYAGTTMGITADKQVLFAPIQMRIEGAVDGKWGYWGAFQLNATADDTIIVYTPDWGATTRRKTGKTVTIENGRVTSVGGPNVPIPRNGYVVWFADKFVGDDQWSWKNLAHPGVEAAWRVLLETHDGQPYPGADAWGGVVQAIGVGPRLVAGGKVAATPASMAAEKFTEAKIVSDPYDRAGVGVTRDGILFFVTANHATMAEFGEIMRELGARDAMAMDSGASVGLVYQGKYLWKPGRELSNALVVLQRR